MTRYVYRRKNEWLIFVIPKVNNGEPAVEGDRDLDKGSEDKKLADNQVVACRQKLRVH
jgi:hypothetical protein